MGDITHVPFIGFHRKIMKIYVVVPQELILSVGAGLGYDYPTFWQVNHHLLTIVKCESVTGPDIITPGYFTFSDEQQYAEYKGSLPTGNEPSILSEADISPIIISLSRDLLGSGRRRRLSAEAAQLQELVGRPVFVDRMFGYVVAFFESEVDEAIQFKLTWGCK
jgi:hypothetical protein